MNASRGTGVKKRRLPIVSQFDSPGSRWSFCLSVCLLISSVHCFVPDTRLKGLGNLLPSRTILLASNKDDNDDASKPNRPSTSKDRAASALSQSSVSSTKVNNKQKDKRKRRSRQKKSPPKPKANGVNQKISDEPYSSLLPPPSAELSGDNGDILDKDDSLLSGLSSWEKFLGAGAVSSEKQRRAGSDRKKSSNIKGRATGTGSKRNRRNSTDSKSDRLPSIQDLFPADFSSKDSVSVPFSKPTKSSKSSSKPAEDISQLEGVLPVSELFYRSTEKDEKAGDAEHDDEELPFSAEQSDALTVEHNKIRIRRNLADNDRKQKQSMSKTQTPKNVGGQKTDSQAKPRGRKVVRRGMEMLVGGVPINPDPPQRSVQLIYEHGDASVCDWASKISLNTREFGPMHHVGSVSKLSDVERGLFCEYFVHSALQWDICPDDLRSIVENISPLPHQSDQLIIPAQARRPRDSQDARSESSVESSSLPTIVGGLANSRSGDAKVTLSEDGEIVITTGEFSFEIGISKEELESGEEGADNILSCVIGQALMSVLESAVGGASADLFNDLAEDFVVEIPALALVELDDGLTHVTAHFKVEAGFPDGDFDIDRRFQRIAAVFTRAMDDGDVALAIADAAKKETRWPESLRDRVVEECLFQDDDDDETSDDLELDNDGPDLDSRTNAQEESTESKSRSLELTGDEKDRHDELFLGGGNEGVFFDYSSSNILNSPYKGEIGLRLVDAVVEKAKQRQPRVLAIGDVHGCIDELQDLLRQCDYRPGDVVVFLGDLVCKGPDSLAVVQMAREIGAIGVRGNHDFEVIRWHQAIRAGVRPVGSSSHYRVASRLSKPDMKWMYSLPWFISSKELGALFVHAGFVSGIRLKKQNPRLMMNMRSILPDGTVTSKFFNNWPWARLWDGPQTVLFGHDADRGLQQYEHAIGLDTGCVYGGRLTACILPEKKLVSVNARQKYFKHRRTHYN